MSKAIGISCVFLVFFLSFAPLSVHSQENNINVLEKQFQEQPENIEILFKLGIQYRISKRYQDSLRVLKSAKEIDPNNWAVRTEIALNYFITGQYEKSLEEGKVSEDDLDPESGVKYVDGKPNKLSHPFYWAPFVYYGVN